MYQSVIDENEELRVRDQIEEAFGVTLMMTPKAAKIDFLGFRGGVLTSGVEIKRRYISSTDYPSIVLDREKAYALWRFARAMKVNTYFVAACDDRTMYYTFYHEEDFPAWIARPFSLTAPPRPDGHQRHGVRRAGPRI